MCNRLVHMALLLAIATAALGALAATEAELRVAMMFNIARFVQWPQPALAQSSFNFCAVGSDGAVENLGVLTARQLHNLPIAVRPVRRDADLAGCHIVYIAAGQVLRLDAISGQLEASRTSGLTIGDAPGFITGGGMVQLLTLEGRQRFRINQRAAEKAGLDINAKLLQLALPLGDH